MATSTSYSVPAAAARPSPSIKPGPIGALRNYFIHAADLLRLPAALRAQRRELPVDGIASATALELGPAAAEVLRRSGVTILAERGDLPWASGDPDFRAQRGQPPSATPDGFRVDASYKDPALVEGLLRAQGRGQAQQVGGVDEVVAQGADRPGLDRW